MIVGLEKMKRFTLERGKWYACEFIGDEFTEVFGTDLCSYSPIKVHNVTPLQSGKRTFRLDFYHANYPQGVQGKEYTLRTIERGASMLLARSTEHDPVRILQIYDITPEWVMAHFPGWNPTRDDVQGWLDRNA